MAVLTNPGFGLPSQQPAPARGVGAVDPRSSVKNYISSQLSGLVTGTSPVVGGQAANSDPLAQDGSQPQLTATQSNAQKVSTSIKQTNDRVALYSQAAARKRTLQQKGGVQYNQGVANSPTWSQSGPLSSGRQKALAIASSYINKTPYVWGGNNPKGTDCAGLVMMVYGQLGMSVDRDRQLSHVQGIRTNVANLQPGDLVAWKDGSHVAIYAGNGQIIEAAHPGTYVRLHGIWSNAVYGIHLALPGD